MVLCFLAKLVNYFKKGHRGCFIDLDCTNKFLNVMNFVTRISKLNVTYEHISMCDLSSCNQSYVEIFTCKVQFTTL